MAGPVRLAIIANGSQAKAELGSVSRSVSRMGQLVKTAAVAGFAGATYAAVTFGKESVRAASEAQQSVGATRAVYGKYAQEVIRTSRQAAQAVGLSANEYRELANVTGAMLQSSGVPLRRTAELTEQLNRRASDMAATFGGTTREAIEAVSALLRGETDPIERYGVSIKESDISARLAAKGLDKLEGSAKKQAQAQARLDLLFQQTSRSAGMFGRESNTLAGQQQRLSASWENLQAKVGKALLPSLTELVAYGNREVVPWISRTVTALQDSESPIRTLASTIGDDLGPALSILGTSLSDAGPELAKLREDLPSLTDVAKVASTGIGFLADNVDTLGAALPFLAAGFVAVKGAQAAANLATAARVPLMIAQVGATRQLAAATRELAAAEGVQSRRAAVSSAAAVDSTRKISKLGIAARGAAGIGGLGALAVGASQADSGMGTLLTTLGGAAAGFAIGGPIGGAVGALGGLVTSLSQTKTATQEVKSTTDTYIGTLDSLTGAVTEATRATAYQQLVEKDVLGGLRELGIGNQLAVSAVLGRAGASAKVTAALDTEEAAVERLRAKYQEQNQELLQHANDGLPVDKAQSDRVAAMGEEVDRRQAVIDTLRAETDTVRESVKAKRQEIAVVKGLPRRVQTKIETIGGVQSIKDLRTLKGQVDGLTRRQMRLIIQETGLTPTRKQLRSLLGDLDQVPRKRPRTEVKVETKGAQADLSRWASGLAKGISSAVRTATRGSKDVRKGLEDGPSKAKPTMTTYVQAITGGVQQARGVATPGGLSVGTALKSGVINGFAGTQSSLVAQAVAAVRAAVSAAKAAAKIKSPSRVMRDEVGVQLGRGLEIGLASRKPKVKDGGRDLIRSLLEGVEDGSSKIGSALDKITGLIEKRVKAKDSDKERKREREILRHLRDEFTALRKNGREQDRNTERLRAARDRYKQMVEEAKQYAQSIKDSFTSFGNVVGLGVDEESGTTSVAGILDQLKDRVKRAREFQQLILQLRNRGLNGTTLQQLIDAGPEAALATAQAIAAGGESAAQEINKLTTSLAAAGGSLGEQMRYTFKQSGIDQAAALVGELERRQKQLDRSAKKMARVLVREVEQELARVAKEQAKRDQERDGQREGRAKDRDRQRDADLAGEMRKLRTEVSAMRSEMPAKVGAAAGAAAGQASMGALQSHARNRLQGGLG